MNKYLVLAYVPPPQLKDVSGSAFLKNIRNFQHKHELVLYSDHAYKDVVNIHSPDAFVSRKQVNRWVVNNLVFLTGLRIAKERNPTHIIYLEADCRVGRHMWDKVITDEFEAHEGALVGGSLVVFNPCGYDLRFADLWAELVAKNSRRNFPIPTYNCGGAAEKSEPSVIVNGALGVYDFRMLEDAFLGYSEKGKSPIIAENKKAWDWEIGRYLWAKYKHDVLKRVVHLKSVYSSYGDILTSEKDRMAMISDDSTGIVGVHQIKSNWPGPDPDPFSCDDLHKAAKPEQAASANVIDCCIHVVSYLPDKEWLKYCLRSIHKFASGFKETVVCLPVHERDGWSDLEELGAAKVIWFEEVPGKGHLSHVWAKCVADTHTQCEHILHMDSDCIFTEPVTPDDYFVDGKPVLLKELYCDMVNRNRLCWKDVTEKALGFPTPYETMCRHPSVYPRFVYKELRDHIQQRHNADFKNYVMKSQFPNNRSGFCEFNAIGNYLMKFHPELLHWIDVSKKSHPHNKLLQFHSLSDMDSPDIHNAQPNRTPRQVINSLGL